MDILARVACSLTLVVVASTLGTAAPQDPPRPEALPATTPKPTESPSIIFEKQHMRVRFEDDGRATRTMIMHVRANDDAGVRQAGQIPLVYAPSSDDLEIASLAVHKPDGRVINAGPEAIQDHAIQPSAQIPMFIDLRQKTVTVPALQPGDMVAVTAVWTVARPLAGRHAWFDHSFVKHAVVTDERLELDVPARVHPLVRMGPSAPAEQNGGQGRVIGDRRIYTWQTSNPVVADDEEEIPQDEEPVADVRITTFPDWKTFADWLGPLMHPAADDVVRAKARELTKDLTDPAAKIDAIYHYVATQIRYVSLSFGLNRYAPHAPGEVLKNEYGDCKDKHALMAAMLREIGVRAVPVLLNTGRSISADMPSPNEFDHVITAIPSGDDPGSWRWFDTTLEIAPGGLLAPGTRDRLALSLGDDRRPHRVVTTPRSGPVPSLDTLNVEAEVNPLGLLKADVRLTARGDTELLLRGMARAVPREMLEGFGKGFARALGFEGEASDFTFTDPLATREPFEIRFRIRQAGYLDWAPETATVSAVMGTLDTSRLDPAQTPLKVDRKLPAGVELRRSFTLRLPPGYTATAPIGVRASKDDFAYTSSYAVDGSVLRATRALEGHPRKLLVAHAADYSRIARSITADFAQKFAIKRAAAAKPEIPDDMSARELYSAGYSAFTAKDYETSIAIWQRAAAKDPKLTTPLNGLGLAYQRLNRYDEAVDALERVRTLEPTNKKINADLGFVYEEAGRFEEAAEAYERHLAAAPLDGARHQTLGEIYLDLDRHEDALAAFTRALPLVKKDPWLHQGLGRALLGLRRTAQAMEAFDTALKADRTPAMTSAIAWVLADEGVESPRVLSLSGDAIASIVEAMTAVTASSLSSDHFNLMERLAWAWDARGMVHLRNGQLEQAITALEAAWQLGATSEMALHLAQAYEKKDRGTDAATYYLVARALDSTPDPRLEAGLKRYYPGTDITTLVNAASEHVVRERTARVEAKAAPGTKGQFNALLDGEGRVIDVAFVDGDEAARELAPALGKVTFAARAPSTEGIRLAVRVRIACETQGCFANLQAPRHVR